MTERYSMPFREKIVEDLEKQRVRNLWERVDDQEFFVHPFLVVLKSEFALDIDEVGFYTDIASPSYMKNLREIAAGRKLDPESIVIRVVSKQSPESKYAMVILGRTTNCDIVIPSKVVSKFHAYIVQRVSSPGSYSLVDGGSKNGTFLNSDRLAKNSSARLKNGDRIDLGIAWAFRFHTPDEFRQLLRASRR